MDYHLTYLLETGPSTSLVVPLSRLAASVVSSCRGRVMLYKLLLVTKLY